MRQTQKEGILQELQYRTSRSSGAGGQHVNKVETRVEVLLYVQGSQFLTEYEKQQIAEKLANRINKEGFLLVANEESRSQAKNKEQATAILFQLLEQALRKPKPRKKTKPSKAAKEKRLKAKKQQAEKKKRRKGPPEV